MHLLLKSRTLAGRFRRAISARLRVEGLEDRATPAAGPDDVFHATVIAGSARATPADTPDDRIDPNTISSPYGGVGSLQVVTRNRSLLGTATVIGPRHVVTAAHVVDLNNDGKVDRRDNTQGVYFILNFGGDQTSKIAVAKFDVHPDFTGFNRPSVNDDLAILTLAEDLPADVPVYALAHTELVPGTVLTFVGYGRSGDGVRGYTSPADPSVKRDGENAVDAFYTQDDRDRPPAKETFRFDFDGPSGSGPLGGATLGNDRETQLGGGDSGGPAFVPDGMGGLILAGVSAFTQGANAPRFGSMGGGVNLYPYLSFIQSVLTSTEGWSSESSRPGPLSGGGGIRVGANPLRNPLRHFPPPPPRPFDPAPPPQPPSTTPDTQPPPDPVPPAPVDPPPMAIPPVVIPLPVPTPTPPQFPDPDPVDGQLPTDPLKELTPDGSITLLPDTQFVR